MSEYNFLEDIEEGIKASDQAEQNVNEIAELISALEQSIKTKYDLELKKRNAVDINSIMNSFNSLSKTANPEHMKTNAEVDFEISAQDMEVLKNFKKIESYGASSGFPVYGGKM